MSPMRHMHRHATSSTAPAGAGRQRASQLRRRLTRSIAATREWFRAFRRTRPFWGGLWTMLAGAWIVRIMSTDLLLAFSGGWNYSAGYTLGGALVSFGLVAWFAPHYRTLVGIFAFVVALAAFPAANLGGYLVGSVLGIIGGSMIWAWGEKPPKDVERSGRRPTPAEE